MEVVPAMSDASPFQRRDVAEWTHRDHLTGVLEKARVETDRWAASTANAKHAYGKVVDSRDRSLPDGSAHQRQRQQLEVYQTKGPGGSLQVIRTQTVTSTNSSSSWRGPPAVGPNRPTRPTLPAITQDFENLQLTLNPIDLSSEKSKASVGRSGSIGARRPPSRPRSLVGKPSASPTAQDTPPSSPVSRICHQARSDQSARSAKSADQSARSNKSTDQLPRTARETGSQSPRTTSEAKTGDQSSSTTTNKDGRDLSSSPSKSSTVTLNGHLSISRKKSSSIEDLHNGVSEDRDDSDEGFKRSSKVRRSLQFPLKKLEARGGVCKLLQELEESSKRSAAEGRIARKSFEALETVLRRNISLASASEKDDSESPGDRDEENIESEQSENFNQYSVNSVGIDDFSRKFISSRNKFMPEKRHSYMDTLDKSFQDNEEEKSPVSEIKNLSKRHSFVTVESLKEVRGRLKHLNSPLDGLDTESGMEELEDNDDGIGTDDSNKPAETSVTEVPKLRVKSYVFGLEGPTRPNRLPILGTGSLESRTSNKASVNGSRSDEWYNRRKSYGFESVHGDEAHSRSSALITKFEDKSRLTSTDSGICRSSDQFIFPSWKRKQQEADSAKPSETEILQISHSIPISKAIEDRVPTLESNKEDIRKGRTTVVTLGSKAGQAQDPYINGKELDSLHCNGEAERMQGSYLLNKTSHIKSSDSIRGSSQSVTVSIPVVQEEVSPSVVSRRLFFQQLSQGTSVSIEKPWTQPTNKGENQMPSLIGSRKIDADDWWRNSQMLPSGNSREEDWKSPIKLSNGVLKRHSIAVDNSWNSFNNLNKSVHENLDSGLAVLNEPCYRPSQVSDNEVKRHSIAIDKFNYLHDDAPRPDSENFVTRKQKKVEFCKTEVHFAAEPGRFNIVETDEKPPPTNMFRRRRRHSTPAPDPSKNTSNLPVVRFGDSVYEKQLLGGTEDLEESPPLANGEPTQLPVSQIKVREEAYLDESFTDVSHSLPAITMDDNDDHCIIESSSDPAPRSILKNYKKPKPYLIGENDGSYPGIGEQKEEKWGVRLRPVAQDQPASWRPASSLPIRDEVMPTEYSGQSELQKLLRSLRPAQPNRVVKTGVTTFPVKREERASECSVAERVRQVEQVTSESKGYSTRVNFGGGEATVVDEHQEMGDSQRLYTGNDYHKPVWQRREEVVATRGNSGPEWLDDSQSRPQQQRSVATAVLSSYNDCDRLRAVETLVSTRSGQPKITSISLRYGEENEPFKFTSKTAISAERTTTESSGFTKPYPAHDYPPPSRTIPANKPAVSSTRLGPPVENIQPSLKERKTFFDRTDIIGTSDIGQDRNSSVQKMSVHSSESSKRGQSFSSFEKKQIGHKRENSPLPKSFLSSRIPNDELIITEVAPEKCITAKQAVHSEVPLKSTSIFDKEVSSRSTQFSTSKQVSASQTPVTKTQNANSLLSSKMISSFERKPPSSSAAGSQSPKPSRVSYPSSEASEKVMATSHRSSPRPRGITESHSTGSNSVRLDTITATSRTTFSNSTQSHASRSSKAGSNKTTFSSAQHTEKKENMVGPTIALHIKESNEIPQSVLGKTSRLSNGDSSLLSPTGKSSLVVSESRRVTRSTSKSPTPTKKVTPPSKNSKSKDFIGRVGNDSPIYQNSRKSASPSNTLSGSENVQSSRLHEQPSPSPIYQNCDVFTDEALETSNLLSKPDKYDCGLDRMESDSAILAELTRAADEILQAVNGYTDEDSRRGSSDDDNRRFRDRRSTPLGTIAEAPTRKQTDAKKESHKTNGTSKRTQRVSSRTKLGPTSSTSSVESFTRETRRALVKSERSSSANPSSRAARLVQRANSRELLLQTNASSSEDIASGTEMKKRAPPPRRSRTSSSSNKDATTSSSKSRDKQKEGGETSRTRERTSSSRTKTRESSDARETRKKVPEMKHHPVKEKTIPAASGLTGGRERGTHARHTTTTSTTRTKKTSNVQEKTTTGAGKRRTETPVQI